MRNSAEYLKILGYGVIQKYFVWCFLFMLYNLATPTYASSSQQVQQCMANSAAGCYNWQEILPENGMNRINVWRRCNAGNVNEKILRYFYGHSGTAYGTMNASPCDGSGNGSGLVQIAPGGTFYYADYQRDEWITCNGTVAYSVTTYVGYGAISESPCLWIIFPQYDCRSFDTLLCTFLECKDDDPCCGVVGPCGFCDGGGY